MLQKWWGREEGCVLFLETISGEYRKYGRYNILVSSISNLYWHYEELMQRRDAQKWQAADSEAEETTFLYQAENHLIFLY